MSPVNNATAMPGRVHINRRKWSAWMLTSGNVPLENTLENTSVKELLLIEQQTMPVAIVLLSVVAVVLVVLVLVVFAVCGS